MSRIEFIPPWSPNVSDGCSVLPFLPKRVRIPLQQKIIHWVIDEKHLSRVIKVCEFHDRMYYYGGSKEDRRFADLALYNLWLVFGVPRWFAILGYYLIRVFGAPFWRRKDVSWAYGAERFKYSRLPALPNTLLVDEEKSKGQEP